MKLILPTVLLSLEILFPSASDGTEVGTYVYTIRERTPLRSPPWLLMYSGKRKTTLPVYAELSLWMDAPFLKWNKNTTGFLIQAQSNRLVLRSGSVGMLQGIYALLLPIT